MFAPRQAETGYGHLRDVRREGDGSTPTGVYGLGATIYGNAPDPGGLRYAYHRLVCGDWWDEDPYSPRYNRFVHVPCGLTRGFASWSEALWTETVAYPYFAVIQFNTDPIVGGRSEVLRWLNPSAHPVIEIGTNREVGSPR